MTLQYIIIGLLFLFALVALYRRLFPRKSSDAGCGGNCKCDAGFQKNS